MKMSIAQKGKKRGPLPETTRKKIGKSNKGKKSIPIQCLETGEVFNGSSDVALFYNLKNKGKALESARAIQNNINHTFNNLHWVLIKDINSPYNANERKQILESLPPTPTRKDHKNDPDSKTHNHDYLEKPIQCIEDLKVFKNSKEASIFYNLDFRNIRMIARDIEKGIYHKNFKLNFIYLKDNIPYTRDQLSDIINNLKVIASAKKVQSLETGLVFESATAAGKYFNIKGTLISDCARDVTKGIDCKSINQHWIYLKDDIPYSKTERLKILSSLKKRKEVESCLL